MNIGFFRSTSERHYFCLWLEKVVAPTRDMTWIQARTKAERYTNSLSGAASKKEITCLDQFRKWADLDDETCF